MFLSAFASVGICAWVFGMFPLARLVTPYHSLPPPLRRVDFDTTLYIYTTTLVVFSLTLAASGFFLA